MPELFDPFLRRACSLPTQRMQHMDSRSCTPALAALCLLLLALAPSGLRAVEGQLQHDERSGLLLLRDSLSSAANLHANWTGPPCHQDRSRWLGITCQNSNVVGIDLEGIQLTGSLPATALHSVKRLTSLSLGNNALRGGLPSLEGLVLLRVVSFAGNHFSGSIPKGYASLPRLSRLELQENILNGTIPAFDQQSLTLLNVSHNFLQGRIPETPALQRLPGSLFDHNSALCGKPLDRPCPPAPAPAPPPTSDTSPPGNDTRTVGTAQPSSVTRSSSRKGSSPWATVLVSVCAFLLSFALVCGFLYCYRRYTKRARNQPYNIEAFGDFTEKAAKNNSESIPETSKTTDLLFFDQHKATYNLDDLLRSSADMVGKGKSGNTYKVSLSSGQVVVVKRLKNMSSVGKKEFVHQMELLGKLKHENLIEIVSFYHSKEEQLVVYEHVNGGSLFQLLHDNRGEGRVPLNWAARLSIVKGMARGLAYLHQSLPAHKAPHGNLKSSNVLVHRWNGHHRAKLTDFGFQPLLNSPRLLHKLAAGRAPELPKGGKLTQKADVYCFGLVVLEVITGQPPGEMQEDLPGWVRLVVNNDWSADVLDVEIVAEKKSRQDMLKLTEVALQCASPEPDDRPHMSEVVRRIEEIKGSRNEERS